MASKFTTVFAKVLSLQTSTQQCPGLLILFESTYPLLQMTLLSPSISDITSQLAKSPHSSMRKEKQLTGTPSSFLHQILSSTGTSIISLFHPIFMEELHFCIKADPPPVCWIQSSLYLRTLFLQRHCPYLFSTGHSHQYIDMLMCSSFVP